MTASRRTRFRFAAAAACAALAMSACGSSSSKSAATTTTTSAFDAAQKRVSAAEQGVTDAKKAYDQAATNFCTNTKSYVAAIDRYGKIFDDAKATVGDVKSLGSDLVTPKSAVTASAQAVESARTNVAAANKELADAQAALAGAQAGGTTTSAPPASTTTTTVVPQATVDQVKKAESDFTTATQSVTDSTPLTTAAAQVNSAAFALEVAWLEVLDNAGCLTDAQHQQAVKQLTDYTAALQTALHLTGYYTGAIDGIYGPLTVDAVKKLQAASHLPQTGYVDRATALALRSAVLARTSTAAAESIAATAAAQATLKLAGYWTGPIDGNWTTELTDALKKFQTALGVPATGTVDTATLAALEETIATAKTAATTTTTAATPTTTMPPSTTSTTVGATTTTT
jgi:peptidoglycan hydrolase-like protein with peptidoglycan-binding domain